MDKEMVYDAAIVGGGLAGLAASILLAEKGHKTVLFEKESYPFHKVCGEYISLESWPFLASLGLPLDKWELPIIKKLHVSSPDGTVLSHNLGMGGFGISRYKLDFELSKIAESKGVKIFSETKVEEIEFVESQHFNVYFSSELIKAKVVLGSFGKRSNIDIKWQRNFVKKPQTSQYNYIGVKYHIQTDFPHDLIELHNFEDGYCGISKVEDDRYCLCYLTTAKNLQKHGSIANLEDKVLKKNILLRTHLENSTFLYDSPLVISQVNFSNKKSIENHVLMVGDSAGLIAPLCGNGMSMALHGAKLASEQADLFLKGQISRDEMEKNYSKNWKKHFSLRLFVGRTVQYTFGKSEITNFVVKFMKKSPILVEKLINLTHGKVF